MVEQTRYARVQESIAQLRNDGATRCVSLRTQARSSVEARFRDKQRMMASAVAEERRPGLFVLAAHLKYGHVARMWLEASAQPRAGLIGRHDAVDLALPLDDSLSLRHLMFVVRRRSAGVQLVVLDLETQHGLQLESGPPVRLVEAPGPLIVCASDFVFFCVPTGQPAPWLCESRDPWATLMPRCVTRQVPRHHRRRQHQRHLARRPRGEDRPAARWGRGDARAGRHAVLARQPLRRPGGLGRAAILNGAHISI